MASQSGWMFIDDAVRKHLVLDEMDLCYYYLLRDSGGYGASNANNRIDNFKSPSPDMAIIPRLWGIRTER